MTHTAPLAILAEQFINQLPEVEAGAWPEAGYPKEYTWVYGVPVHSADDCPQLHALMSTVIELLDIMHSGQGPEDLEGSALWLNSTPGLSQVVDAFAKILVSAQAGVTREWHTPILKTLFSSYSLDMTPLLTSRYQALLHHGLARWLWQEIVLRSGVEMTEAYKDGMSFELVPVEGGYLLEVTGGDASVGPRRRSEVVPMAIHELTARVPGAEWAPVTFFALVKAVAVDLEALTRGYLKLHTTEQRIGAA